MVSVVVTCYNYGRYLAQALDSVLVQTWTDFEIVVVDDGSTDDTPDVMERYRRDARIHYVRQDNAGQSKAKNRGIRESRGEFVAFLDADDLWSPEKLALQMPLFQNPKAGVVYSRRSWIDPDGNPIPGNERTLHRGEITEKIFIDNFICFSSSVVRRNLLEKAGGFDEALPMGIDYDLWLRLSVLCDFDYVDQPLTAYRFGHANLSKNIWKRFDCARRIMDKALATPEIRKTLPSRVRRLGWSDTYVHMGYAARKEGDFDKAAAYYLQAIRQTPLSARAWRGLVACRLKK